MEKEIKKEQGEEMERTIVVSVIEQGTDERTVAEYLDELEFLALTAGVKSIKRFTQKLERSNSRTYVGTGKLEEIKQFIEENELKLVLFDDELSPSQLRNLEKELAKQNNAIISQAEVIEKESFLVPKSTYLKALSLTSKHLLNNTVFISNLLPK